MRYDPSHGLGSPLGDNHRECDGGDRGQRQGKNIELPVRQAADHGQHQQAQYIVDHRGRQNDLAGDFVEQSFGGQHLGGNPDAGRDHGCANEDGLFAYWRPRRA